MKCWGSWLSLLPLQVRLHGMGGASSLARDPPHPLWPPAVKLLKNHFTVFLGVYTHTHTCYTDTLLGFLIHFPPIVKEERCMNPEFLCKLVLVIPIVSLIHSVTDAEVVTPHLQRLWRCSGRRFWRVSLRHVGLFHTNKQISNTKTQQHQAPPLFFDRMGGNCPVQIANILQDANTWFEGSCSWP